MKNEEDTPTSALRRRYLSYHRISGVWILVGIGAVLGLWGLILGPSDMPTTLSLPLLIGAPAVTGIATWLIWWRTGHKSIQEFEDFIVRRKSEFGNSGQMH
jgi:hypothetical protein